MSAFLFSRSKEAPEVIELALAFLQDLADVHAHS